MSKALIAGITQVANEKGLDREVIFEAIEAALVSAYKRNFGSIAAVTAEVDRVTGEMNILAEREVVEEVITERTEVTEDEAKKIDPNVKLGDIIYVKTTPDNFGRIAAQTAKQVILQRIREAERDTVYENFAHRVGELINAQVRSVDTASGAATILIEDKHESLLMRDEQIPRENLRRSDYIRLYIVDVHKSTRGPVIKLSRTHRNLLRRLLEQEIPEVRDGVVEIKAIAREPGARSKVSVTATQPGVDAVGSCVGLRGLRIQNIVNELAGEKIDVVEWDADLGTYIANALSPAKVNNVILDEKGNIKTAVVIVPDRQLSLAIGKEGQNARLAAKLTGWRIDIKSESEAIEEGLDRLAQAQIQATMTAGDSDQLMAIAERILKGDDEEIVLPTIDGEDMLSKAAQALEEMAEQEVPLQSADVPSFDDVLAQLDAEDKQEAQVELPAMPDLTDIPEMPILPDEEFYFDEEEPEEEPSDALPNIITADMLRAGMANRKKIDFDSDDFEIPAELLVGLDEEEGEEEDEEFEGERSASKKKKPVKKKAKQRKRRPSYQDEDDYRNYY